ncbi:MAG: ATP-binding cassette domain-containing protein [Bacteroidales bacterium]|jgi:ABC-2 type transport system ATP-binding protein|nr:ATP-binding cassette domain-containing protein [Bacteroidales bacterium]
MDIKVENLTKTYGSQKAVDDISFSIHTGEVLGFLGPNGAGKTTTMKAITTFLVPNKGKIMVGRYNTEEHPEEVKKHIGYLPENNPLYPEMPVIDYLRFAAEMQGVRKDEIRNRILEMVHLCGLEGEKHKNINELSKGYQQRVGLAQALIHDPDVLILDEPTSGLDPNQIVEIRQLIKEVGKEKTVILSSHILAEVEATCDRIMIINKGKIVANGTAKELRKQAQGKEMLQVTIEDGNTNDIFEALKKLPDVEAVDFIEGKKNSFEIQSKTDQSSRRSVYNMCVKEKWTLMEMSVFETKLEDVFRELTLN